MSNINRKCPLCNGEELRVDYSGPMRSGGPGSVHVDGHRALFCDSCEVGFLDPFPENTAAYESNAYWVSRNGDERANVVAKLGVEQGRWLAEISLERFFNRDVADFGAGHGVFLDMITQFARTTTAIEPAGFVGRGLMERGHKHVPAITDLADGCMDIVVSFDTLEHVERPGETLAEIYRVLKPGGTLFLGAPNHSDFLKKICEPYLSFFYHLSHIYYFTAKGCSRLLEQQGFQVKDTTYVHKYNMMNMISWVRDGVGRGNSPSGVFDEYCEDDFRGNIERQGVSSHFLIEAQKKAHGTL